MLVKNMKVKVDRAKCIGCGTCTAVAPRTFELDKEGKAIVKNSNLETDKENIQNAANSCPTGAILVKE